MPKIFSLTTLTCSLLAVGLFLTASARQAEARPQYVGFFAQAYPEVAKKNNVATKVKCGVCHPAKGSKKMRNDYGKAIAKALGDKKNVKKKDKDVFDEALKKVADEKSASEGKTFGDLLKEGELPGKK